MKKISILVPMFNEQEVLPSLYDRLSSLMNANPDYEWEVVMVDDGSQDNTALLALQMRERDKRFHIVELSRNFGKETAMLAGIDTVSGDCMVIMDADLQHPPEVIPEMIKKWEEGYDDVYGKRISRGKEPWLRKKLTEFYYNLLQKSAHIPIIKNVGDFRLLDKSCVNALRQLRETHRYTKGLYCYIGFKKTSVDFEQGDREAGETKWNYFKLLGLAIEGITSYTTLPLRIATMMGSVISMGAMIYLVYVLFKTFLVGDPVAGFPTIIVCLLFLGGIILLTLGVLGEYIARIFDESKQRPAYFIREVDGKRQKDGRGREIE
ncbi:MAG: glycosyltransferase family 2 protein [Muribaculaceae bacterium]|nr:glycosyltransferase family 2 protein [Muribaculaceae bacterium]